MERRRKGRERKINVGERNIYSLPPEHALTRGQTPQPREEERERILM